MICTVFNKSSAQNSSRDPLLCHFSPGNSPTLVPSTYINHILAPPMSISHILALPIYLLSQPMAVQQHTGGSTELLMPVKFYIHGFCV